MRARQCHTCGVDFLGGPRAWYCPVCRQDRKRRAVAEYRARRRAGRTRPLGTQDRCERCGAPYLVVSSLQRFCPACQPIHRREHDRLRHFAHRDRYRLQRRQRRQARRKRTKCKICGTPLPTSGPPVWYCTPACRQQWNRLRQKKSRDNLA